MFLIYGLIAGIIATLIFDLFQISLSYAYNINKSNFIKRYFQEKKYGKNLVKEVFKINPDVIISANAPLTVQNHLSNWANKNNKKFIFWLQDIISIAALDPLYPSGPIASGCFPGKLSLC